MFEDQYGDQYEDEFAPPPLGMVTALQIIGAAVAGTALAMFLVGAARVLA